jgi:hypothetical protein
MSEVGIVIMCVELGMVSYEFQSVGLEFIHFLPMLVWGLNLDSEVSCVALFVLSAEDVAGRMSLFRTFDGSNADLLETS